MKSGITTAASMCLTAVLLAGTAATAGELPKSTQMMVKALKLEGKPFTKASLLEPKKRPPGRR